MKNIKKSESEKNLENIQKKSKTFFLTNQKNQRTEEKEKEASKRLKVAKM